MSTWHDDSIYIMFHIIYREYLTVLQNVKLLGGVYESLCLSEKETVSSPVDY